jgi:hypothetical protein
MHTRELSGRRRGRIVPTLAVAATMVGAIAVVAVLALGALVHWNPFATTTTERPDPVALAQIRDLARFDAATGRFQTVIDQTHSVKALPNWVAGDREVMIAEGDVDASVDLSRLPTTAIEHSADGKSVTVHLPSPTLNPPRLDPKTTRVITRDRGVVNRVGDALGDGNPVPTDQLQQRASDKLSAAAAQSDLRARAETNTRSFVTKTLEAAGFQHVTVVFDNPLARR